MDGERGDAVFGGSGDVARIDSEHVGGHAGRHRDRRRCGLT